jgi:hypothetical protein
MCGMCGLKTAQFAHTQIRTLANLLYFRAKFVTKMEQQRTEKRKKSTGLYWLLFLASSALLVFAIWAHWEYLTLILPFQITFFAKALDIM